jgi:hypothetical protein
MLRASAQNDSKRRIQGQNDTERRFRMTASEGFRMARMEVENENYAEK